MANVTTIFGGEFADVEARIASYELLRTFIAGNHDWAGDAAPNSDTLVARLRKRLRELNNRQFAFLLCHSGYIPEDYGHDSSEETIYTKLVEALVQEWAIRLGFTDTELPKQKASKEDVTIKDDTYVIVGDAKSYRLGRSQKAPNVKDALKEGDIAKWFSAYDADPHTQLGGLITFPSQHDWSGGSDYYFYLTKKDLPIVCLFYEHMAYLLLVGNGKERLISLYQSYADIFPSPLTKTQKNKAHYWLKVLKKLFEDITQWNDFNSVAQTIIKEKVFHTINEVTIHLNDIRADVAANLPKDATKEQLRELLIDAQIQNRTFVVAKQVACIQRFRDSTTDYLKRP